MNKTRNIIGVIGMLLALIVIGYLIFTAKELGI